MKVLISDKISNEAVNLLKNHFEVEMEEKTPEELLEIIPHYDALIVRSKTKVTKEVIEAGKSLKVVGRAGIGVDNIDIDTATVKKIPVVYSPRGSTITVAEITVAQIINLARNLVFASITTKQGKWLKKSLKGMEINGKTLGLIGLGRIGIEVAKRCKAFNMNIIAFDPYIKSNIAKELDITLCSNINEIYENSDFISIHSILTDETKGMLNLEAFKKMKNTVYVINYSRGGIINEKDLVEAVEKKLISGAALDVFENEPLTKDSILCKENLNILLTPHIGATTYEAQLNAGTTVAKGVIDVLLGKTPEYSINLNKIKQL